MKRRRRPASAPSWRACAALAWVWCIGALAGCASMTNAAAPTTRPSIAPTNPPDTASPVAVDDSAATSSPWSAPTLPDPVVPQLLPDVTVVEDDTYALPLQDGIASYYARRFAGRKTSSGDRYDPKKLTCAHKRVRLGHRLRVVDKDGRSVTCLVNDRGPYKAGRVVDLSLAAAQQLDLPARGIARVHVEELLPAGHPRLRLPIVGAGPRPGAACARRGR